MRKFFKKIKDWFIKYKPSKRKIIQLYAALLTNANVKGFIKGDWYKGATKNLCVPGLNCYSCPGAIGACPLGSLQNALSNSDTRLPAYIFGIIILFGLTLGRTICGWLCPIGWGQELLYKIKTPKVKKSKATRVFSYFKYVLLIVLVGIIPLTLAIPGFCEYICPAGTFEGGIGLLVHPSNEDLLAELGPLFTWKFTLLVLIVVACIFFFRFFCRFLCPLGALYGFFCRIALLGVKLDKTKCTNCGMCVTACKMDIKRVGDHECIQCGECIAVCPTKAISWKGSKLFVRDNDADAPAATEIKPLLFMLKKTENKQETVENVTVETVPAENAAEVQDE